VYDYTGQADGFLATPEPHAPRVFKYDIIPVLLLKTAKPHPCGIRTDDNLFADSVSVDMHGVFLFLRHGFPPLGNENPALAMAFAGVKGKKERALPDGTPLVV
jgi:hypothetical protein